MHAQELSHVQLSEAPPGSSVHGILQARILEWVAISSSRGIFPTQGSNPHLLHWQMDSLSLGHLGVPCLINTIFIYSYYHSVYRICPFKFFFFLNYRVSIPAHDIKLQVSITPRQNFTKQNNFGFGVEKLP